MPALVSRAPAIPEIDTERLTLRGHRVEELEECYAMWADPGVTRYITGRPSTREEVWGRLVRYVGHWALLGFGCWVVREKATGRFVGEIGFANYERDLKPPFGDAPEAGWVLTPSAHGKGYATEALKASIAWLEAQLGKVRTVCMISPENAASIRVAEKCGYREYARTEYHGNATILFERPQSRSP
jgi:RimJ/RimL family protein N-acetyltransferase